MKGSRFSLDKRQQPDVLCRAMPDLTLKLATLRRVTDKALLLSWYGQDLWIPRTQFRLLPEPLPPIGSQMTCTVSE